ncbi:hypothetical protein QL285_070077 [Trifolium repens]|nr:hypothetical protein QL285_070077 [Trifolium repens]
MATIQASSDRASFVVFGSIKDTSPNKDSSSLKFDLVFLGLFLFPRMSSSGCEDLYLKVFLGISVASELSLSV